MRENRERTMLICANFEWFTCLLRLPPGGSKNLIGGCGGCAAFSRSHIAEVVAEREE